MFATASVQAALVAVNDGIELVVPVAAIPTDGLSLVHEYVTVPPVVGLLNAIAETVLPLHLVMSLVATIAAVGLTVTVYVTAVPVQPFADGVMLIVAVTGAEVALIAVNDGICVRPLALARPTLAPPLIA
ncbi:hypothetical protein D3C86_1079860 [compost metagenome]